MLSPLSRQQQVSGKRGAQKKPRVVLCCTGEDVKGSRTDFLWKEKCALTHWRCGMRSWFQRSPALLVVGSAESGFVQFFIKSEGFLARSEMQGFVTFQSLSGASNKINPFAQQMCSMSIRISLIISCWDPSSKRTPSNHPQGRYIPNNEFSIAMILPYLFSSVISREVKSTAKLTSYSSCSLIRLSKKASVEAIFLFKSPNQFRWWMCLWCDWIWWIVDRIRLLLVEYLKRVIQFGSSRYSRRRTTVVYNSRIREFSSHRFAHLHPTPLQPPQCSFRLLYIVFLPPSTLPDTYCNLNLSHSGIGLHARITLVESCGPDNHYNDE